MSKAAYGIPRFLLAYAPTGVCASRRYRGEVDGGRLNHNRGMMRILALFVLLSVPIAPLWAQSVPSAQSRAAQAEFSFVTDRDAVISLAGKWRFQPKDDLRFANPALDDSDWRLLESGEPWTAQGYKTLSGFAWYRFRVVLPAGEKPFTILLPVIYSAYQVFLDGALVHTSAAFPPSRQIYYESPVLVPVPGGARPQPRVVSVAIRVWHAPVWANYVGGGPEYGSEANQLAGPSSLMESRFSNDARLQRLNRSVDLDLACLDLLAGMTSIALFLLRRSELEYLFFGIAIAAPAIPMLLEYTTADRAISVYLIDYAVLFTRLISRLAYVAFFSRFLHAKSTWLLRLAIAGLFLNLIPMTLLEGFGLIGVGWASLLGTLTSLPFEIWVIALLLRRSINRLTDARLLLAPVLLVFVLNLVSDGFGILESLNHPLSFSLSKLNIRYPFLIRPTNLADGFFLLAMLAILVNRFARTRREQDRTISEFEAARSVQQVMIPEALPTVPGIEVSAAYYPAQEVGGDFFQVLPLPSAAVLVIVGDVAGKGMPAALTVSLAVGSLRTLADYTTSPGEILAGLNRRLHGRGTGFTTCLALHLSPDHATLTVANAGHLSPYLNGRELATEPNLPLGLDPDARFVEMAIRLREGDHLTVITDGVPEAMHNRTLFGFERTLNLSRQPATEIAAVARSFGQVDDITVLTLDVLPTGTAAVGAAPILEPEHW